MAHHPWNFHDFPTWLGIPWKEYFFEKKKQEKNKKEKQKGKNISVKNADALYVYAISFLSYIAAFWTPLSSEFPSSFVGVYGYFLELHNLGDCK